MKNSSYALKIVSTVITILIILCIFIIIGCKKQISGSNRLITIGSKNFTEQEILGELMAIIIEENTDINVKRKFNLGGTMVCFNALKTGDLDLYAEYTGTGLVNILKMGTEKDPDITYQKVKEEFLRKFNLVWLKPFGFNNTYALTMREEHASYLGIKKISDLEKFKDKLRSGFTAEFMQRPDGYPGLIRHYGFEFTKNPRQMDPGLMYKAVEEEAVDIVSAFATDGRIQAYRLVVLVDDRHFFPPYYAAPLIKGETMAKYPELKDILNKLHRVLSDSEMQKMNYQVDEEERAPADVAREFLKQKSLIF